jgi:integrase
MPKSSSTIVENITEKTIGRIIRENRPPVGGADRFVWDRDQKGFGLRIYVPREAGQPTRAAFVCRHAKARATVGDATGAGAWSVADAREKAGAYTRAGKQGIDLRAQERQARREAQSAVKLGALIDTYLEARKPDMKPRSYDEIERQLRRRDWRPLHGRAANDISRDDVIARVDEIARDNGRVAADRARTALSGLFTWAIERGHDLTNPCIGVAARAPSNGGRQRVLSESELREVWLASDPSVAGDHGRIVRLLILIGQRRNEIGDLKWIEIVASGAGAQIELAGQRTKNGKPHVIPLSTEAMACLPLRPSERREYIFGRHGRSGFSGWSKSKSGLDERILEAKAAQDRSQGQGDAALDRPRHPAHVLHLDARAALRRSASHRVDCQSHQRHPWWGCWRVRPIRTPRGAA